ncbi:MAG TPA: tyrosine/phenylalanine carboxypeptidase domain-containing protein [Longimicrobiales bacterium]|nr:tyrosine/phenylalanine carboxypeptidase domain-containing protein [Longimicrobiales bacterium]
MATRTGTDELDRIVEAYLRDEAVTGELPGGGHIRLDRRLPYLLVHRRRAAAPDPAAEALLSGEASYAVLAEEEPEANERLARRMAEAGAEAFGAFLLLELWAEPEHDHTFRVLGPRGEAAATVEALRAGLEEIRSIDPDVRARTEETWDRHPPGLPPLLSISECHELGTLLLGLEVPALYRGEDDVVYPVFLRALRRAFSRVLRRALFDFVRVQSRGHVENWHGLGRRTLDDSVWDADRELADIARAYELLLLVSPVDEVEAWERFRTSGFEAEPDFHYRLLPIDPDLVKRRLYALPLERVTDPAAGYLLRDKREEIDRQVSLLAERGSPTFLHSSIRLYGAVDDRLLAQARAVLEALPGGLPRSPDADAPTGRAADRGEDVDAAGFADAARREIDAYRATWPDMAPTVQVRPDLTGLMVSKGHLLIGSTLRIPRARLEPLLHHEVGTHVLTFWNGSAQPLTQLAYGLADYDEFQEGLAVLSEYLVEGLSRARMRLLAARVLAAHSVQGGGGFVDTFRLLNREHGFTPPTAFGIATRVHAGGGFTRDLIYLRGLLDVLEHLREGGELDGLYVGKLARKHMEVLEELLDRGVLRPPPLRPRFLDDERTRRRLERARGPLALADMVRPEAA